MSNLSKQEIEVIKLISLGLKSAEIAEKLFISPHTVKNHKSNICLKLDLKTTSELYLYAFSNATLLQNWEGGGISLGIFPIFTLLKKYRNFSYILNNLNFYIYV